VTTVSTSTFSMDDLMTLLVARVGLRAQERTDDPCGVFADVGLDSLAFLQLQLELQNQYQVDLPDDRAQSYTFGEIVTYVNAHMAAERAA
jgi:minimal PKS acyl carrier protein